MLSSGIFKFVLILIAVPLGLLLVPTIVTVTSISTTGMSEITKLGVKVLPFIFFGVIAYAVYITIRAKVQ